MADFLILDVPGTTTLVGMHEVPIFALVPIAFCLHLTQPHVYGASLLRSAARQTYPL